MALLFFLFFRRYDHMIDGRTVENNIHPSLGGNPRSGWDVSRLNYGRFYSERFFKKNIIIFVAL